jgi:bacteriorhodopsin
MDETKKQIKTYRECNYPITISFFKVGASDFVGIFLALIVIIFVGLMLVYVYPPLTWGLYTLGLGFVTILFYLVRREYRNTGRSDVVSDWFDYFFLEKNLFKGREDE